nr:unnamed protein product [Callosobruchus analis]
MDCTHIAILTPIVHEDEYVNRKGFCSLNVQVTCMPEMEFTNVDASWTRAVHESRIWRNSDVYNIMQQNTHVVDCNGFSKNYSVKWLFRIRRVSFIYAG